MKTLNISKLNVRQRSKSQTMIHSMEILYPSVSSRNKNESCSRSTSRSMYWWTVLTSWECLLSPTHHFWRKNWGSMQFWCLRIFSCGVYQPRSPNYPTSYIANSMVYLSMTWNSRTWKQDMSRDNYWSVDLKRYQIYILMLITLFIHCRYSRTFIPFLKKPSYLAWIQMQSRSWHDAFPNSGNKCRSYLIVKKFLLSVQRAHNFILVLGLTFCLSIRVHWQSFTRRIHCTSSIWLLPSPVSRLQQVHLSLLRNLQFLQTHILPPCSRLRNYLLHFIRYDSTRLCFLVKLSSWVSSMDTFLSYLMHLLSRIT